MTDDSSAEETNPPKSRKTLTFHLSDELFNDADMMKSHIEGLTHEIMDFIKDPTASAVVIAKDDLWSKARLGKLSE